MQYKLSPKEVDSLNDMLSKGIFYGRLRSNSFFYDNKDNSKDYIISGFGGSLIYKSAYLDGFGFTTGFYTTKSILKVGNDNIAEYRAGKDTFSRYDKATAHKDSIESLAQAFIEYRYNRSRIRFGRQLFESFLTKSNDTKMIPNSFEGLTFQTIDIPSTKIKTALLTKQKLRDHSKFHHILAYGDNPNDNYTQWSENDDGAMHRGLTLSRLKKRGIDDRLVVFDLTNRSLKSSTIKFNYTVAPELLSYIMIEGNHKFDFENFRVIPSMRFMYQFDNGAGEIAEANLKNNTVGYRDKDSLDAQLFAFKVDLMRDIWSLRFGYSTVANRGDIVAPWRGFPTAGYTRAMGQTNWYANTDAYLIRADYNLGKAGVIPHSKMMMRYVIQDFDDDKAGVQSDSRVVTFDIVKKGFISFPSLYTKLRVAHISGDSHTIAKDGTLKKEPSYNEIRLEFNYLF